MYSIRGSIYTTIRELGPKSLTKERIMGPNSLMVVYVDPLGVSTVTGSVEPRFLVERPRLGLPTVNGTRSASL